MTLRALISAAAAALIVAGGALGAAKTTEPSRFVRVTIVVFDTRIVMGAEQGTQHHGDMIPLAGPVPRGDYVSIDVLNRSKLGQRFTIFNKKTRLIKPGGKGHLFVAALVRGQFLYKSTSVKKVLRGYLTVG